MNNFINNGLFTKTLLNKTKRKKKENKKKEEAKIHGDRLVYGHVPGILHPDGP